MATCNSQNVGTIIGRGRSKKGYKKAFNKALSNVEGDGNTICVGGTCATGSCGFRISSLSASYGIEPEGEDGVVYTSEVTADGDCACV